MNWRSTTIGFAAVIVLMSAAAAQGLAGENTVFSDDIVDGTVKHIDIKENTIGSSRMLNNSVHSVKISDGSVVNADIHPDAGISLSKTSLARDTIDLNFPNLGAGACGSATLAASSFGSLSNDIAMVTADASEWPPGLTLHTENDGGVTFVDPSSVVLIACNVTGAAIDPPDTTFDVARIP